ARQDQGAYRKPAGTSPGPGAISGPVLPADRSGVVRDRARTVRSWPLLLAFPAAAEVWSGWVGIARKTGFGLVSPLPGIWSSFHLDTTITLPVGVEAYAAYALRAWLATDHSAGTIATGPGGTLPSGSQIELAPVFGSGRADYLYVHADSSVQAWYDDGIIN